MKRLLLLLLFTATLYANPPELAFLETMLPNSKHVFTHVVGMAPTGMIIIEYKGNDKIETVVSALDKALGVKLTETPDIKNDRFQVLWDGIYEKPPSEHKRVQADGLTIDIAVRLSFYEGDGTTTRFIHVYIVRKGP